MNSDRSLDESRTVRLAARGDPTAIRMLYDQHADRVFTVVRRFAGSHAQAEDWAQEVWLRVFRSLKSFREEAAFGTWIHRIALNVGINGKRKAGKEKARSVELVDVAELRGRTDRPLLRMDLVDAIDGLPDGMRTVLILHDVEGFTHHEIADRLGISEGTCKSQLFKARAKVRRMLDPIDERRMEERYAAPDR